MDFFLKIKNNLKKTRFYYWRLRYLLMKESSSSAAKEYLAGMNLKENQSELMLLANDLHNSALRYGVNFGEYFFFNFQNHEHGYRKDFVGDLLLEYFCLKVNKIENREKLDNKFYTATIFESFFKRDVFEISSKNVDEKRSMFLDFCELHDSFIAKPLASSMGRGVRVFTVKDYPSKEELFECLKRHYCFGKGVDGCLIEEILENVDDFKKIHPESLNTIRMPTFRYGDRVEVLHPFCRFGCGKSIVDNAGAGGVICTIDPTTGKIMNVGDERGRKYTCHPDTLFPLKGWKVPQWHEAVNFAQKLADVIPDNGYCAWDIALTSKGWVMIEGNARGQFVWQGPDEKGFKPELLKILHDMKKKG